VPAEEWAGARGSPPSNFTHALSRFPSSSIAAPLGDESGERLDLHFDAGAIQRCQIAVPILNLDNRPRPPEASIAFIKKRGIRPLPSG
jgi:hypothetical protein